MERTCKGMTLLSIEGSEIYVFFPDEPKIGVKTIKNYIKRLVQEDTDKAIVLIQQHLTPFGKRFISDMRSKYYLEVFQEAELLVQEHVLVPEHKDLKNEEKKTLLERFRLSR
ncbi:putative DNA-directed RNA polymerase RPB5 subunit, eukaryote/virus [Rosa chinensis]|uniref:Putative DNA-directed RNA polymerase RPB5 subunit, eukaryote/virus n=1 Tax=Rosa chinensis TaxID=74649 RepID=A0A2P6SEF4_ROSCH|nr:putative DNA-directed RNA polymerase RPB5 subunit, eukaryote/virus [Rosa chinensis]